ncbi:MAG: hypothetical protein RL339_2719 [Pseudomonadota bacterium]|jgi:hypothetical protein
MEMNFWTALVIIVAITAFANIRMAKYRAQGGLPKSAEPARMVTSQRENELLREVEDLRERVRVLERIATDGRGATALANEIESLRGPQD